MIKILSVRQPWASLIVLGFKDVENRTWRTDYRGPLLIHASKKVDSVTSADIARHYGVKPPSILPLGGIVGIVDVVDCLKNHASKWYAPAHYGFVLANSRSLPFVQWRGAQGLRDAPDELLEQLALDDVSSEPASSRNREANAA
jgi:ASCH domain